MSYYNPIVSIYTDGSCSGNPGPGGWGAVLLFGSGSYKELWGHELYTTNNRMELKAAIEALTYLNTEYEVEMFTDSRYLELGITYWIDRWLINNWQTSRNGSVKNIMYWQKLVDAEYNHASVNWNWVRGHSRDENNDKADYLARKGCNYAIDILNSSDY